MGARRPNCIAECDRGYNWGYTGGMKTAVSLPDELFRQADAAAKKLRISRSKLYATAISEYLSRKRSTSITERLNAYYSRHPAKIDPALATAQLESLDKKW